MMTVFAVDAGKRAWASWNSAESMFSVVRIRVCYLAHPPGSSGRHGSTPRCPADQGIGRGEAFGVDYIRPRSMPFQYISGSP